MPVLTEKEVDSLSEETLATLKLRVADQAKLGVKTRNGMNYEKPYAVGTVLRNFANGSSEKVILKLKNRYYKFINNSGEFARTDWQKQFQ